MNIAQANIVDAQIVMDNLLEVHKFMLNIGSDGLSA